MTNEEKIMIMKNRYEVLKNKKINEKCSGVLRKLTRQLRNAGVLA
jgi:hypothetical protein